MTDIKKQEGQREWEAWQEVIDRYDNMLKELREISRIVNAGDSMVTRGYGPMSRAQSAVRKAKVQAQQDQSLVVEDEHNA